LLLPEGTRSFVIEANGVGDPGSPSPVTSRWLSGGDPVIEVREVDGALEARLGHELVRIEPWGQDSLRVRVGLGRIEDDRPGALDLPPKSSPARIEHAGNTASITHGSLAAHVLLAGGDGYDNAALMLRFVDPRTGRELLAEQRAHFWWPGPRLFASLGGGRSRLEQHFAAYADERLFGLGQRPHGRLDQKGMALDLIHRNGEVSIPFVLSSRGYGFLWNNPGVGHVELAANRTRWVADASRQIDYWITAGRPAEILARYADATGHAPMLPDWAAGFWQSKLRYRSQEELLAVAREHKRRGLPMSVIVADFFHWKALGDWSFDASEWPDPRAMVHELHQLGIKLMVSVWPIVSSFSQNYAEMAARGLFVAAERGLEFPTQFPEKGVRVPFPVALYDSTNPAARQYIWSKVKENYLDLGVDVWWLDACEPEVRPLDPANLRFHAGPGDEVVNLYPLLHARAFHEGMLASGRPDVVSLVRSAWAGSQKYGAALWSGDIPATFDSLRRQVRAGLNVAISGIPWWTTDIGGFHGGDPEDPEYRELIVRWFQYGAFCPLFRLHGDRLPRTPTGPDMTGGPNEVWSFGDEAYRHICEVLALRERLRPYVMEQMRRAHVEGIPPMRPLFVDYPDDPGSWAIEDEFLLGPDVLVAPIATAGERRRDVYLPPGLWHDAWTADPFQGPGTVSADAPLNRIPVFVRAGAVVPIAG
jgi:alpha-D-xyloside xylohydrolase